MAAQADDSQHGAQAPGLGAAAPDQPAIVAWLEHLYDPFDTGWLTLFSVDRTTGDRHVDWHPIDDYDTIADRALARADTCCVWFGVATRRQRLPHGRGGADDCHQLPGLWLDIDIAGPGHRTPHPLPPDVDTARRLIARFPLEPTLVAHSGGGLQAWWLFPEPHDVGPDTDTLLARWGATWARIGADKSWHIDNVFDVARIMRLPGTLNRKTPDARPVLVIESSTHRYDPTELDDHLEDPPPPPERPAAATVPYIGPERPGDAFNTVRHGHEILSAAGWEMHHRDRNGDEHWTRPGKQRREGSSATVYADDGHTTIWSDAIPGIEVRRPYDPFGLYTVLFHRGDFTAASDELERQGYGTKARAEDDLSWAIAPVTAAGEESAAPGPDPDSVPGSTWARTSLRPLLDSLAAGTLTRPQPTIGRFTTGDSALYYPGRVNGLYGESGNGKSWIALALAAETMLAGGTVAWIDIEEPAEGILARLVIDLGLDPDLIADRFLHFAPEESIRLGAALFTELDQKPPALVVIDSTGEALTLEGAGPNNDDEVATWFRTWPRRLATRYDAAVLVIDHVVKDQQNRGLHPGGSQRKRAAISGSAFMVEPIKTLGIGVRGVLKLTCAKDRQGNHRQGHKAGEFILDATQTPTAWQLDLPAAADPTKPFRPTTLMERISRWLADEPEPATWRSIQRYVPGNTNALRQALDVLVDEGYVERRQHGASHLHMSVRPYSEATEMAG